MKKGKLIVLEGIDGSGKSTQLKLIKQYLLDNNLKFEFLHFPKYGHNIFSEMIAKFLRGEFGGIEYVDPYFVANIYAMDRYLYLPTLLKQLEKNDVVILDRYVFSNIAYQGAKLKGKESNKIKTWIRQFEFNFLKLPYPDLSFFFDVPIKITKKRLEEKRDGEDKDYLQGKKDIHEADLKFQSIVRDNYLSIHGELNYKIIPCTIPTGDYEDQHYYILNPQNIFESYKKYLIF